MILVSFFFSHQALPIGIGRDGIKLTEIAQTNTHSAFNVLEFKNPYLTRIAITKSIRTNNFMIFSSNILAMIQTPLAKINSMIDE